MSTTTEIELQSNASQASGHWSRNSQDTITHIVEPGPDTINLTTAIPDGGYGWTVVFSCSLITFWFNGLSGSWGVIQAALLSSSLPGTSTSTITFVGSLALGCVVGFTLIGVRLMRMFGARTTALFGISLLSIGEICSGFTTSNIGGLFGTSGLLVGVGTCFCYTISNAVPTQYFSSKLGLANGLVKLGGGLGATVLAIALEALIQRVGTAWTFRILGFTTLITGIPAAWLIKERTPLRNTPFVDFSMFRNLPFAAIFASGAIGTFALFIPPYFLPLFARSIGLSSSVGAGLVAGFNACTAIGRFGSGPVCDKIGPVNTFLIAMSLNALSMLAIWPVSDSLGPLILFAMINGVANGAFFTSLPTVLAEMVGPGRAAVAMAMSITGWTGGYLMGAPIAGYLVQATGASAARNIDPYRPAIFYAGGVALASSAFVLTARLLMDKKVLKRL